MVTGERDRFMANLFGRSLYERIMHQKPPGTKRAYHWCSRHAGIACPKISEVRP